MVDNTAYDTYKKLMSIGHPTQAEPWYLKYAASGGTLPRVGAGARPTNALQMKPVVRPSVPTRPVVSIKPKTPSSGTSVTIDGVTYSYGQKAPNGGTYTGAAIMVNGKQVAQVVAPSGFGGGDSGAAYHAAEQAAVQAVLDSHGATDLASAPDDVKAIAAQAGAQAGQLAYSNASAAGLSDYQTANDPTSALFGQGQIWGNDPTAIPDMHVDTSTGNVTANPSMGAKFMAMGTAAKAGIVGGALLAIGLVFKKKKGAH